MKKICLLLILSIVLTGCVYESFRSLYGDEWMADHLPNQESADQSNDTGHIGATPIINISDNTNDSNGVTGDSSNDTIIPSVTTTTIRYTITFNANGGSGTMEDITMINGEERALPLCSFTAPLGKKFSCWLASDNNYASYYRDREVVKDLMSENGAVITLSAQWLEQSQYSIFYYNTMNAANSNPTTFFESESVTLQNLSVTGYDFVGWNDAITGKRITGWAAGERTSNITLGAEWTPHSYTVIYYGNGGAGQTEKQTVSYGETFTLRENGFTWDGHVFIGWCVSSNATGTNYSAGQSVSNLIAIDGGIVELYALWEEMDDNYEYDNGINMRLIEKANDEYIMQILDLSPDLNAVRQIIKLYDKNIIVDLTHCKGLTKIERTSNNDYISVFGGLENVIGCKLPDTIKIIGVDAFARTFIKDIVIPDSVTSIGSGAFSPCYNLMSIVIPNSVTEIGNGAFSGDKLKSVTISNSETCPLIRVFSRIVGSGAASLTNITVPSIGSLDAVEAGCNTLFSSLFEQWEGKPNGFDSMSYNGRHSYAIQYYEKSSERQAYYCKFPTSLKNIGVMSGKLFYGTFMGCNNLTSITLGEEVEYVDLEAFDSNNNITELRIMGDESHLCELMNGFASNFGIYDLYLNDQKLTDLTIPSEVTDIPSIAFVRCKTLEHLSIPQSVNSIGNAAFADCDSLTDITVTKTNPPILGTQVFRNVSPSIKIYVPASSVVTYKSADGWSEYADYIYAIEE